MQLVGRPDEFSMHRFQTLPTTQQTNYNKLPETEKVHDAIFEALTSTRPESLEAGPSI